MVTIMKLTVDPYLQAVLEFMQTQIPTHKLVLVAESLAPIAKLLWGNHPQEPCRILELVLPKLDQAHPSQSTAIESAPAKGCADGDFVEAGGVQ